MFHIAVMLSEKEFIKVLSEMTAEWYMFGCAMRMSTTDLDIIEDKIGMERHMKKMLEEWLKTGSATWEKLQEALGYIGNKQLADELTAIKEEQQQCKQLQVSMHVHRSMFSIVLVLFGILLV